VPFIVGADGIQDPGNLGTLIRSAAGAGVSQVVTLPGTADPWAPKTVRAAAGAQFLVPIASMSLDELAESIPDDALVLAADSAGEALYDECDLTGPLVVIVGSEGEGLSPSAMTLEPVLISIPLASGLESLNAGVAGSIVLFEASRQRRVRANLAKP
jgi:TrmH family RNA methyltransferase